MENNASIWLLTPPPLQILPFIWEGFFSYLCTNISNMLHYHIEQITTNKRAFMPLLLLGDEQESMIDRYLDRGEMFALIDTSQITIAIAVVTREDNHTFELKNLAVTPSHQRKGYGRTMIDFICHHYSDKADTLLVGTGDSPHTISFYKSCGFRHSHTLPDFFTQNYDHPIIEDGKLLRDMIYLKKVISR